MTDEANTDAAAPSRADIVKAWYEKHIWNSVVSRNTGVLNDLSGRLPALTARLEADGAEAEAAVTSWANSLGNALIAHNADAYAHFTSVLPKLTEALRGS